MFHPDSTCDLMISTNWRMNVWKSSSTNVHSWQDLKTMMVCPLFVKTDITPNCNWPSKRRSSQNTIWCLQQTAIPQNRLNNITVHHHPDRFLTTFTSTKGFATTSRTPSQWIRTPKLHWWYFPFGYLSSQTPSTKHKTLLIRQLLREMELGWSHQSIRAILVLPHTCQDHHHCIHLTRSLPTKAWQSPMELWGVEDCQKHSKWCSCVLLVEVPESCCSIQIDTWRSSCVWILSRLHILQSHSLQMSCIPEPLEDIRWNTQLNHSSLTKIGIQMYLEIEMK